MGKSSILTRLDWTQTGPDGKPGAIIENYEVQPHPSDTRPSKLRSILRARFAPFLETIQTQKGLEDLLENPTPAFLQACSLREEDLANKYFANWLNNVFCETQHSQKGKFERWFKEKPLEGSGTSNDGGVKKDQLNRLIEFLESIQARRIARVKELQVWKTDNPPAPEATH